MKHSNLYLGLVLPSGGWQSLIGHGFIIQKKSQDKFKIEIVKKGMFLGVKFD